MRFDTEDGPLDVEVRRLTIAGWTGRDAAAVRHHIDELAALGVAPPSAIPLYYRAAPSLLTQAPIIDVLGTETSGEAEPFVLRAGGALWLGLASDHTDRGLEAHSVAHSKQICAKPVATRLWRLDAIAEPDALTLAAEIREDGAWTDYQRGTLAAIRPLDALIDGAGLGEGDALLCGTLPAIGAVRPAAAFRMSLRDPATGAAISHAYEARPLAVVD